MKAIIFNPKSENVDLKKTNNLTNFDFDPIIIINLIAYLFF